MRNTQTIQNNEYMTGSFLRPNFEIELFWIPHHKNLV